jgi:hypothetical protein
MTSAQTRQLAAMLIAAAEAKDADQPTPDQAETPAMTAFRLNDLHRRIRTILKMIPATDWTVDEAAKVWQTLVLIRRDRQAATAADEADRLGEGCTT